ncbi:hypothetical protein GW17_00013967 [Ensete ventricosum]|nr:hypothetical protein GW17_00013967 [Ensete ventricosum]
MTSQGWSAGLPETEVGMNWPRLKSAWTGRGHPPTVVVARPTDYQRTLVTLLPTVPSTLSSLPSSLLHCYRSLLGHCFPPIATLVAPDAPTIATSVGHPRRLLLHLLFILSHCCSQANGPSADLGDAAPNHVINIVVASLFPPPVPMPNYVATTAHSYPLPHQSHCCFSSLPSSWPHAPTTSFPSLPLDKQQSLATTNARFLYNYTAGDKIDALDPTSEIRVQH